MNETRKQQRIVNRVIRRYNKMLLSDDFLKQRFTVREICKERVCYEDGWTQWHWRFEIKDSKTSKVQLSGWYSINSFTWVTLAGKKPQLPTELFWEINDFILERRKEEGELWNL